MEGDFEQRAVPDSEFRADAQTGTFSGHASAFRFVDDWGTAFLPGAFKKTIKDWATRDGGSRIPAVWFHDPSALVGPVTHLSEDDKGLRFEAKAVEDGSTGSMVLAQLRGGSHIGMSFSFRRIKDRSATEKDGIDLSTAPDGMRFEDVRAITEAAVREISPLPITFASQPKAMVTDFRSKLPALLDALRNGTLDESDAVLLAEIVRAWNDRAAADASHSTPDATRRNRRMELESMFLDVDLESLGVEAA